MTHELKVIPKFFKEVLDGTKNFEVRKKDRPFKVGDLLALNEYNIDSKLYSGQSCLVYIDYILDDPEYCKEGYVILGIKPCLAIKKNKPISEQKLDFDYTVPLVR